MRTGAHQTDRLALALDQNQLTEFVLDTGQDSQTTCYVSNRTQRDHSRTLRSGLELLHKAPEQDSQSTRVLDPVRASVFGSNPEILVLNHRVGDEGRTRVLRAHLGDPPQIRLIYQWKKQYLRSTWIGCELAIALPPRALDTDSCDGIARVDIDQHDGVNFCLI